MFMWSLFRECAYIYLDNMLDDTELLEHTPITLSEYSPTKILQRLPPNVLSIIKEYSQPMSRPDWRNGSYCNHAFKYNPIMLETYNLMKKKYQIYREYNNTCEIILNEGERFFKLYPYYMLYNNFYFYLCSVDNALLIKKSFLKKTNNFDYKYKHIKVNYEYKSIISHVIFNKYNI